MILPFVKYQAAGNDFILFDDRKLRFPAGDSAYIAHLCHRHFGIGANGVLLVQPSTTADIRMRIFNPNGKEASQCGNGLRCVVDFLYQGLSSRGPLRHRFMIETQTRVVECTVENSLIRVDLGAYLQPQEVVVDSLAMQLVHTGVPHAVAFVSRLDVPNFKLMAAKLRSSLVFAPDGANINFAHIKDDKIYTRTYERGVEDETLACGTGAAAVAVAASQRYQLKNPICVVPASQEELFIEVLPNTVQLSGKANAVFQGTVLYGN